MKRLLIIGWLAMCCFGQEPDVRRYYFDPGTGTWREELTDEQKMEALAKKLSSDTSVDLRADEPLAERVERLEKRVAELEAKYQALLDVIGKLLDVTGKLLGRAR